jgi:hypothetical protein
MTATQQREGELGRFVPNEAFDLSSDGLQATRKSNGVAVVTTKFVLRRSVWLISFALSSAFDGAAVPPFLLFFEPFARAAGDPAVDWSQPAVLKWDALGDCSQYKWHLPDPHVAWEAGRTITVEVDMTRRQAVFFIGDRVLPFYVTCLPPTLRFAVSSSSLLFPFFCSPPPPPPSSFSLFPHRSLSQRQRLPSL